MQQIGPGPDIWRRASQSPAPRPVLENTAALRQPVIRPRRPKRGKFKLLVKTIAFGLACAVAALTFAAVQRPLGYSARFVTEVERWLEMLGLGLQQVSVVGYRFTPDGDIFDAIGLASARTLLTFDSRAAQTRIEQLPWVERASIERVVPDRIEVRVSERAASAVWTLGARHYLIDKTGRVLTAVAPSALPPLPRIVGEGAAREAGALFAMLGRNPEIARQLDSAERVGQRRWTLRLAGGTTIELPAEGAEAALARAGALATALNARAGIIDLRVAGRTLVREAPGKPDGAASIDALLAGGI